MAAQRAKSAALVQDAQEIKLGAPPQFQPFFLEVDDPLTHPAVPHDVASAQRISLSSPADSMTLVPLMLGAAGFQGGAGDEVVSSTSAIIMVRFNGTGPWFGMQLPLATAAGSPLIPAGFALTISFIDWYVYQFDGEDGATLAGFFGTNVSGSTPNGGFGTPGRAHA